MPLGMFDENNIDADFLVHIRYQTRRLTVFNAPFEEWCGGKHRVSSDPALV